MRSLPAPWRLALVGALVGLGAAGTAALDPSGLAEVAELKALDLRFAMRGVRPPTAPIIVVRIDEDSFDELGLAWPFPRALHARLLDEVSRGGPAVIGLDLVFAEPSSRGPEDDQALAEAVARAGTVVLAAALTTVAEAGYVKQDLNPPVRPVRDGAAGYGIINFHPDRDAFVRRALLARAFQGGEVPSFARELYRLAAGAGVPARPLPASRTVLIDFPGGPGVFPWVPYHRILSGEVPAELFAGKIVLVGATTPVLHDVFPAPFAPRGDMPGVEIQASLLDTLLGGRALRLVPPWAETALAVVLGAIGVWAAGSLRPVQATAVLGVVLFAYLGLAHAVFLTGRWWLPVVPAPLALLVGFAATDLRNYARAQRERRRLSRFFSPDVVSAILRGRDDTLASARRVVTVLFCDVRGFTALSERMTPEEVATFLREYLTTMTEVVFVHGGTVDKYVGDAIMALYNVPFPTPDHAARAVRTALDMVERLRPLADRVAGERGARVACGVGIHTGEAVVGTLGSRQRREYTAVGDAINLGARLEGLTKDFDVPVVISEAVKVAVESEFTTRFLGEVTVRGRAEPVRVYTVLGRAPGADPAGRSPGGLA